MPLAVGYAWDGFGPARHAPGAGQRARCRCGWSAGWLGSGIPQRCVYPVVGDLLAVVQAFGIDAEQNFDAVPGPLGHVGGRDSRLEPQRHCRVAKVVGTPGERRGDLRGGQGEGPGLGPDIADRGGGDGMPTVAAEDPAVRSDAEGVDVRPQDRDQLGRVGNELRGRRPARPVSAGGMLRRQVACGHGG